MLTECYDYIIVVNYCYVAMPRKGKLQHRKADQRRQREHRKLSKRVREDSGYVLLPSNSLELPEVDKKKQSTVRWSQAMKPLSNQPLLHIQ